jgi:hypothetical protein
LWGYPAAGERKREVEMNVSEGGGKPYARWHKAVLAGCLVLAVLGTVAMIGGMVTVSGTISEYGGTIGAPVIIGFIMGLLSIWLFAGSGALLVYIAKTNRDLMSFVRSSSRVQSVEQG